MKSRSQRFVFFVKGRKCQDLCDFLLQNPGVRDVTKCIFLFQPEMDEEWIEQNFDHQKMDAESNHPIHYISFAPQNNNILQTPPLPKSGWKSIEVTHISHAENALSQTQQRTILLILDNLIFQ